MVSFILFILLCLSKKIFCSSLMLWFAALSVGFELNIIY